MVKLIWESEQYLGGKANASRISLGSWVMSAAKRSRIPSLRGWDASWSWIWLQFILLRMKGWQKEPIHMQLLQNCAGQKKSLEIHFSLWIRPKKQVRNWAPNSSEHGLQRTWGQPNLSCLGSGSVSTNYLSFLASLSFFSCFPFTPSIAH